MSAWRAAVLALGHGEWAIRIDGEGVVLVRVARYAPLHLGGVA